MLSIILQAQAAGSGMSSLVMLLLLFLLVFGGVWLYRKKSQGYASGMLGWLSAFFIVAIAGGAIAKSSSLHAPAFPIVVIEGLFLFVIIIWVLRDFVWVSTVPSLHERTGLQS